jgi:hypothetical protein
LSAQALATAATREPGPFLVELVYEVDTRPLEGRTLPSEFSDTDPLGYVVQKLGETVPATLYPALGKPLSNESRPVLWIARRFRNRLSQGGGESRTLHSSKEPKFALRSDDSGSIAPFIPVEVVVDKNGTVKAKSRDREVALKPGESVLIALAQKEYEREAFADAIIAVNAERNPDAPVDRKRFMEELLFVIPGDGPVTLYARLSAIHHGEVTLGGFDVLHEWREARRFIREGPYELAEEALENVLAALPDHDEALRLYERVLELVSQGVEAASIRGVVVLPDGQPTQELKDLWQRFHAGFVVISDPADPQGGGIVSAPVEDGKFTIFVPAGEYQLMVAVPGFEPVEQTIRAVGTKEVRIALSSTQ